MIVTTITNRKTPTPTTTYTPTVYQPTTPAANLAIFNEVTRRDKIVKELFKGFKHVKGDKVNPSNAEDVEKFGKCTIISVVDSYIQLEKDFKWPANDNPMIVTASSTDGEIFYATTNYFEA